MTNISTQKERILKFLEFKGISKNKFYIKTGISNGVLDKKSGLSMDTVEKFYSTYEEVNAEWLLTGKGDMLKPNIKEMPYNESMAKSMAFSEETKNTINAIHSLNKESPASYNRMPKVVTVDKSGNDNVILVPVKAAAGYLLGYGDSEYIQSLPTFNLPNIQNGTFRMFQVSGHSMYPTLSDACYVVGEWVENWIKDIKDNRIYVVVSDEGILVKRVLNRLKKYDNLYLKSDNRKEYPNRTLEPSQIKEVWAVKMHLSFELPDPTVLYDRVGDLEAEIDHIKSLLKKKN